MFSSNYQPDKEPETPVPTGLARTNKDAEPNFDEFLSKKMLSVNVGGRQKMVNTTKDSKYESKQSSDNLCSRVPS